MMACQFIRMFLGRVVVCAGSLKCQFLFFERTLKTAKPCQNLPLTQTKTYL